MQLNSPTITQAVHQLKTLPPTSQQTALNFINFLVIKNAETAPPQPQQNSSENSKKPKRQFGQMVGKGSFKIKDDFEIELI